jgi:4-hydroxy-2-oxoheptanedioate aldolase
MRPNLTKRLLAAGKPAIGLFCTTASALGAEALGHAGYDFVTVDMQHSENDLGNLQGMLQAVSATPATPLVRVPANMAVYIQRSLDMGAYGVMVPLVNTREEAEAILQSVRYAPAGARSWGPVRGMLYGGPDYFAKSSEELLTIVMLETAESARNAREILATPGIDACFIGPNDLCITLGFPSGLLELPAPVEEAIGTILQAAQATGKAAGIQVFGAEAANARIAQGFRFVSVMSDIVMMRQTAAQTLKAIKR